MQFPLREKIAGEIALSDQPGKTMRKWREELHISQTDLANHMRVSPSVISDYEAGRRDAGGGVPTEDRREVAHAAAEHTAARERIHGHPLDQGHHDARRERLPSHLRHVERAGPALHGRQVRTISDDRDQGPSAQAGDGRLRSTGERRRAGGQAGGAGQHHPRADGARSTGADLETGADRMKAGIVSYGGYIPRYRIRPKDIGIVWGADGEAMGRGLNIRAKSVPGPDEDV